MKDVAFGNRLKILIVEDSPTQAEQLKYILEENDFRVTATRNGREALEALRLERPTLVLTDITMPEMDGYELCRLIRADPHLAELPVILLTALGDPEDVFKGLECGADNFVTKPYDQDYLLARIRYLLANAHLRRCENVQTSMEVFLAGQRHVITSDRAQILNLLLSTYEAAVRKNRELAKARDELTKLNEELEEKVLERTASLAAENAERKRAEAQVRQLNEELEQRVRDRTSDLEAVNKELEAFSYSVSHDLRAPLRAVRGFSRLLHQRHSTQMPAEAQQYLNGILNGAEKMEQLITDLLQFSRLGRQPLFKRQVNVVDLVRIVLEELRPDQVDRQLRVDVGELPDCVADPSLLKQVLFNLLSNAFKFTRAKALTVIEVGHTSQEGENVYFVRDNGAGFDMRYVDKLFGVFQRLHREEEFPGTGVGLSIVQRIIQRHGGRIWAEGEPNKGATFYFTLAIN